MTDIIILILFLGAFGFVIYHNVKDIRSRVKEVKRDEEDPPTD